MRVRSLHLLALLIGLAAPAGAQDADPPAGETPGETAVSVQVEPGEVKLAESFSLIVRVGVPGGQPYRLPDVLDLSPFIVKSRSQGKETVDGIPVQVFRLTLVTFDEVGQVTIPGFDLVPENLDGGGLAKVPVPESRIKVVSMLAGLEQPEPRDLAGPVAVAVSDYRLLVFVGFLILWVLLALTLRFWTPRTRTEKRLEVLPPARQAHEIALEKLNRVVQEDLLRRGRVQEFFVRVSDAVREYLGNRYGFFALDLTTRELLEELRDRPTPGLEHGSLARMLRDADLVKFARQNPSDQVSSALIDSAFELVHRTKLTGEQVGQ